MRQWKKINGTDRAWWSRRKRGHRRSTCRCSGQGRGLCWVSSAASSFCPSNLPAILAPLAHLPLFFSFFSYFSFSWWCCGGQRWIERKGASKVEEEREEREVVFVRAEQTDEVTPFFLLLLSDHSNGLGQLGLLIFPTLFVPSPTLFSVFRNPIIKSKLQWKNAI